MWGCGGGRGHERDECTWKEGMPGSKQCIGLVRARWV